MKSARPADEFREPLLNTAIDVATELHKLRDLRDSGDFALRTTGKRHGQTDGQTRAKVSESSNFFLEFFKMYQMDVTKVEIFYEFYSSLNRS